MGRNRNAIQPRNCQAVQTKRLLGASHICVQGRLQRYVFMQVCARRAMLRKHGQKMALGVGNGENPSGRHRAPRQVRLRKSLQSSTTEDVGGVEGHQIGADFRPQVASSTIGAPLGTSGGARKNKARKSRPPTFCQHRTGKARIWTNIGATGTVEFGEADSGVKWC